MAGTKQSFTSRQGGVAVRHIAASRGSGAGRGVGYGSGRAAAAGASGSGHCDRDEALFRAEEETAARPALRVRGSSRARRKRALSYSDNDNDDDKDGNTMGPAASTAVNRPSGSAWAGCSGPRVINVNTDSPPPPRRRLRSCAALPGFCQEAFASSPPRAEPDNDQDLRSSRGRLLGGGPGWGHLSGGGRKPGIFVLRGLQPPCGGSAGATGSK
jgi:hypothetical protein